MRFLADSLPVNFMIPEPTLSERVKTPSVSELVQMVKDGSFTSKISANLKEAHKFFVQKSLEYVPYPVVIRDSIGNIVWYNKRAGAIGKTQCIPDRAIRYIPGEAEVPWPLNTDTYYNDDIGVIRTAKPLLNLKRMVNINGRDELVRIDKIPYRDQLNVIVGVLVFSMSVQESTDIRERYLNKVKFFVHRNDLLELALQSRLADKSNELQELSSGQQG